MSENNKDMPTSRSFNAPIQSAKIISQSGWKSDMYIPNQLDNFPAEPHHSSKVKDCCGEYYKKYEHDDYPVKDYGASEGTGDNKRTLSLTNSQLACLESNVLKDISQELKADRDSSGSIDSNIKIFKITCQQIFDTFYSNMQGIELYKKKFHEILEKNKIEFFEMEEFIKEMIQHMSTESVTESHKLDENEDTINFKEFVPSKSYDVVHSVIEAYKNENYNTDSTTEETMSKVKHATKTSEVFNIYLLNNAPCIEIRMNDRTMLSEINIKNPHCNIDTKVASADNLKKIATKKKAMERHGKEKHEIHDQDVEIPIKFSSAKKNIHLDEDFSSDHEKIEKSLMSKICGFLCKRFRKNL